MKNLLALLALALLAHAAQAQTINSTSGDTGADQVSPLDRFQLWADCAPVDLLVEGLSQDAIDLNLTVESLETLVRSRLRSARIYSSNQQGNYLYLNVNVFGPAFSYRLQLNKVLADTTYSGFSFPASVWYRGVTGTHGGDAGFIRQSISGYVDVFIDEYLRVNAESCVGPGGVG